MALTCTDIGKLVHPYLDGEFSDEDRVALEQHTAECGACRDLVQYEMAFKASMRAKLSPPKASSGLRRKVLATLDAADKLHSDSEPRRLLGWLLPSGALAAAAAAVALFFLYPTAGDRPQARSTIDAPEAPLAQDPWIDEIIRARSVSFGTAPEPSDRIERELTSLQRELSTHVGVQVKLPRLGEIGAYPTGAWVVRISDDSDRRAARVQYRFDRGELSVYTFNPRGMGRLRGHRRQIGTTEVVCDKSRGYLKAFYEKDGVGRMYVSGDLSEDEVLRLIELDLESR